MRSSVCSSTSISADKNILYVLRYFLGIFHQRWLKSNNTSNNILIADEGARAINQRIWWIRNDQIKNRLDEKLIELFLSILDFL